MARSLSPYSGLRNLQPLYPEPEARRLRKAVRDTKVTRTKLAELYGCLPCRIDRILDDDRSVTRDVARKLYDCVFDLLNQDGGARLRRFWRTCPYPAPLESFDALPPLLIYSQNDVRRIATRLTKALVDRGAVSKRSKNVAQIAATLEAVLRPHAERRISRDVILAYVRDTQARRYSPDLDPNIIGELPSCAYEPFLESLPVAST